MTIYYSLTFVLLIAEMITFCVVLAPMPSGIRRQFFGFLNKSLIVAKIVYGLKISFIFVGVLFADAVLRMYRVGVESQKIRSNSAGIQGASAETNLAARKFYSQRNMYLTGFCLYLSLILTRTFYIILESTKTEEQYAILKKATASQSRKDMVDSDQSKLIETLKAKLAAAEASERDFETLKKQSAQQAAEYDRLATEYNEAKGLVSNKRVD